jgi:SAM-dependent methyltransferase
MQAYGAAFARAYDWKWAKFAREIAPRIREFYENLAVGWASRSVLDLCCGTGCLAGHFLENGYEVTGVDLSEPMLEIARGNASRFIDDGRARFIQADAAAFESDRRFGLAVSTFDSLNHLPDLEALKQCFRHTASALLDEGVFIFDLNTRLGLARWNGVSVEDDEDGMIVTRGFFDASAPRAHTRISGFVRRDDGRYDRFEETAYNTAFDVAEVRAALEACDLRRAYAASPRDLATPLGDPERYPRVFFVATK